MTRGRSCALGLLALLSGLAAVDCGGGGDTSESFCAASPCAPNATCNEAARSCTCPSGYGGDGFTCYPVRTTLHGLCVVADFLDSRLEDYTGSGFKSTAEIQAELADMTKHWRWMSVNTEEFTWDVIRIQLPRNLTPGAYAGWPDFRRDVVERARAQLGAGVSKYDGDGDGILDAVWVVPAAKEREDCPYLVGGASRNAAAGVFVDSQGSLSVRRRATGNFNHEVGHLRGLPDVYGRNDTLSFLSLMSSSWPTPPVGFSAFDRLWLDWLKPNQVTGQATLTLPDAETHLEAVLVPGVAPFEYVLIEYRKRPTSGYGSSSTGHDGLAIFHVYEVPCSNVENPPFLRLQPADGSLDLGHAPDASDFWSPENTRMLPAYHGRSYYTGEEFVSVTNVVRADGKIRFDVQASPVSLPQASDLVVNPNFSADASAWTTAGWNPQDATFEWQATAGRGGSGCISISASQRGVDAWWEQTVLGLTPGAAYELRGWIRGENILAFDPPDANDGARLSVFDPNRSSWLPSLGTFDWTTFSLSFTAESTTARIACRLGGNWSLVTGKAWFDDLALVRLGYVPDAPAAAAHGLPVGPSVSTRGALGSGELCVDVEGQPPCPRAPLTRPPRR